MKIAGDGSQLSLSRWLNLLVYSPGVACEVGEWREVGKPRPRFWSWAVDAIGYFLSEWLGDLTTIVRVKPLL